MINLDGQKSRDMISIPLGIPNIETYGVEMNEAGDYIIPVESMLNGTKCQHCG